ncbi:hypothetical protein Gotur_020571 [Gossypium turneri]
MVVYARFKYEKLSLFCFICGKLGHGESYCPYWLTIDSSKIVFGWDLSLRAEVRRRSMVMSRWLRTVDGSPCNDENLAGVKDGNLVNMGKDLGLNARGFGRNLNPKFNPNLIPLGTAQIQGVGMLAKGRDGNFVGMSSEGVDYGPTELALVEENDPLTVLEGKKWQRVVESSHVCMDTKEGSGLIDVSASSDGQSSQAR